ncbi:helix-turn-helix transcriptional regulator [Pseudooceanicola aestuarii]|uniref:helix-turn-helix transcriptional regulator n=1 Tax=Pseudooceanicola aestuarii TaxID=2697319 RepID=UPI0013D8AC51|nr:helix-turn-helix domain-containing protein [Pseudooceanicola aestuarii]
MTTGTPAQVQSGKYMMVLDDRLFYVGLAGRKMQNRRMGGVAIYLAPRGHFRLRIGTEEWQRRELAILPPYQAHQVHSEGNQIISVLIETERLYQGELPRLLADFNDPARRAGFVHRMRDAAAELAAHPDGGEMLAEEFDRIVLGRALREGQMDPRIARALETMKRDGLENPALAAEIAAGIGLSSSRFLHLFKDQTGVSFRNYRMWRRARSFMLHANQTNSLTDVALSLGYPDSSHFSNSIRKTFGLQPRSIRIGSRDLRMHAGVTEAAAMY